MLRRFCKSTSEDMFNVALMRLINSSTEVMVTCANSPPPLLQSPLPSFTLVNRLFDAASISIPSCRSFLSSSLLNRVDSVDEEVAEVICPEMSLLLELIFESDKWVINSSLAKESKSVWADLIAELMFADEDGDNEEEDEAAVSKMLNLPFLISEFRAEGKADASSKEDKSTWSGRTYSFKESEFGGASGIGKESCVE